MYTPYKTTKLKNKVEIFIRIIKLKNIQITVYVLII